MSIFLDEIGANRLKIKTIRITITDVFLCYSPEEYQAYKGTGNRSAKDSRCGAEYLRDAFQRLSMGHNLRELSFVLDRGRAPDNDISRHLFRPESQSVIVGQLMKVKDLPVLSSTNLLGNVVAQIVFEALKEATSAPATAPLPQDLESKRQRTLDHLHALHAKRKAVMEFLDELNEAEDEALLDLEAIMKDIRKQRGKKRKRRSLFPEEGSQ